jgi:hypothetical protein
LLHRFWAQHPSALAQSTPVGLWRSFDDKTGEPKVEVRITEAAGVLNGKVEKRLSPGVKPDDVCTECTDDRKDKPKLGLEIIRGAKKSPDGRRVGRRQDPRPRERQKLQPQDDAD